MVPSGWAVGEGLGFILNPGLEGLTFLFKFSRLEAADSSQVPEGERGLDPRLSETTDVRTSG